MIHNVIQPTIRRLDLDISLPCGNIIRIFLLSCGEAVLPVFIFVQKVVLADTLNLFFIMGRAKDKSILLLCARI
ncbi:hypothetical protein D3C75_1232800 [compost metagenome]